MNWILAAVAPAALAGVLWGTGRAHPAILAYHVVCAAGIVRARRRIGPLFSWNASTAAWTAGTTAIFLAGLFLPLLFWDPAAVRAPAMAALFPWKRVDLAFVLFSAYTMVVHCPLEEVFWRGAATDAGRVRLPVAVAANAGFFYLVHVGAMAYTLGALGWLLAIPTGLAGGAWAYVTLRSRSIWPALISHWAVDAAILWGMWFFFVRR